MSTTQRNGLAMAVVVGTLALLAALSQAPYTAEHGAQGVLRLSWRARGERVEKCRRVPPEELERLPPHMRQAERCEGRVLPYRLRLVLDGQLVADELVRPSGARHDRPLYVLRELRVSPGSHRVAVDFAREGPIPAGKVEQDEGTPPELQLDTTLVIPERRAVLVTYDEEALRLVVKTALER